MDARSPSVMLDAALAYARGGWLVFPCNPSPEKGRAKSPLTPKETSKGAKDGGLYLATTDEAQIRTWWRRWPKALIGLRTGPASGVFVLDLDPKAYDADSMLRAVADFCGGVLPPCPVVRTQSGGLHLYFQYPKLAEGVELGNRGGLFAKVDGAPQEIAEHVDVRGEGGYVILPPSTMADGKVYSWEMEPEEGDLAPAAPVRLLDVVLRRGEFARGSRSGSSSPSSSRSGTEFPTPNLADEAVRRYALTAFDREIAELSACPQGRRGDTLNRTGYVLGTLVGAGALMRAVAEGGLREACSRNGLVAVDGWDRVNDTISRSLDAGESNPRDLSDVVRQARERADRWQPRGGSRLSPPPADPTAHAARREEPRHDDHDVDAGSEGNDDYADPPEPPFDDGGDCEPPREPVDMDAVRFCSGLDHSDTDNGERLIRHFGKDLVVLAQDEVAAGAWMAWTGTHWDLAGGAALARITVQKLGGRILLEADHLAQTPREQQDIAEADKAAGELSELEKTRDDWTDVQRARARLLNELIEAGRSARGELAKRKVNRRKFAISSKNKARMEAALDCAAPRLRRPPDSFNVDRYKVATLTHTLTFVRGALDDECPDPAVKRYKEAKCHAVSGHSREDWITAVIPIAFAEKAKAKKWRAFLERMLPDADKRRTVQMYTAMGLLGVPMQYLMFHYGLGANGKSVFLETVTRLLGPGLAVGLPRESIVGASERAAGSASPDLVRLYGKKMVRILEVKGDAPLQEDLIKRLTGGEALPVRTLFKGYFEFQNVATAHMSGNGFPTVDGSDNGIWRRLLVVHWDQVIPEEERRDFEEVVSEFIREEGSGILWWMIEGVLDYLQHGFFIAPSVRKDTAEYREEMDPVSEFVKACVRQRDGGRVQAHTMYDAYVSWSMANAKRARTQTKFGRVLAQQLHKGEVGGRIYYLDCELHDVPERPDAPRNP